MTGTTPSPPRSADEQRQLDRALVELFEQRLTFNQVLGLSVLSVRPGDVRGRIVMRPELVGHYAYGRLHGGVISATLDAMGGLALLVGIGERHPGETAPQILHRFLRMGTIDLRIDYLRPGIGVHFIASAEVTRLGGRLGSTQMRLVNDEGTLIATGAASYVIS
jgi:uncharacterized protein (TIGR00369 family)